MTLGSEGVVVAKENSEMMHYPCVNVDPTHIRSVIGLGDNFMGGFIYGLYNGKSIETCVRYGQQCAVISIKSERTVSDEISHDTL